MNIKRKRIYAYILIVVMIFSLFIDNTNIVEVIDASAYTVDNENDIATTSNASKKENNYQIATDSNATYIDEEESDLEELEHDIVTYEDEIEIDDYLHSLGRFSLQISPYFDFGSGNEYSLVIKYWMRSDYSPLFCIQRKIMIDTGESLKEDVYNTENNPFMNPTQHELISIILKKYGITEEGVGLLIEPGEYIAIQSVIWMITEGNYTSFDPNSDFENIRQNMETITKNIDKYYKMWDLGINISYWRADWNDLYENRLERDIAGWSGIDWSIMKEANNNKDALINQINETTDIICDTIEEEFKDISIYIPEFASKNEDEAPTYKAEWVDGDTYKIEFSLDEESDQIKDIEFDVPEGWSYEWEDDKLRFICVSSTEEEVGIRGTAKEGTELSEIECNELHIVGAVENEDDNQHLAYYVDTVPWSCYFNIRIEPNENIPEETDPEESKPSESESEETKPKETEPSKPSDTDPSKEESESSTEEKESEETSPSETDPNKDPEETLPEETDPEESKPSESESEETKPNETELSTEGTRPSETEPSAEESKPEESESNKPEESSPSESESEETKPDTKPTPSETEPSIEESTKPSEEESKPNDEIEKTEPRTEESTNSNEDESKPTGETKPSIDESKPSIDESTKPDTIPHGNEDSGKHSGGGNGGSTITRVYEKNEDSSPNDTTQSEDTEQETISTNILDENDIPRDKTEQEEENLDRLPKTGDINRKNILVHWITLSLSILGLIIIKRIQFMKERNR